MKRTLFAICLALAAASAGAQTYPAKPVHVIVPYPAGGIVDIVARSITEKIAADPGWKQPILIEAKPGAQSNLGTELVAKAEPDGHTWLATGPAILSNPAIFPNLRWGVDDFQAVGIAVWNQNIAVVPASSPAKTLKDFVAMAKDKPGQLNYGNPGTGSSNHLQTELFLQVAGIRLTSIGYKGQPPAIPDLLQGLLHFKIVAVGLAVPHIRSGKLRPLAVITQERLKDLPDVPTMSEAGYPAAGLNTWYGIYVPAKTPKPVVARINAEINKALAAPDVQERLIKSGSIPGSIGSPEEIQALMKSDAEKWAKVVKAAGIKGE
jgi:tripartite-type tricarboxylate transporter receptor subunit TctC